MTGPIFADNDPLGCVTRQFPDGGTIAFTYKGDIYTVPATGGKATQLTTHQGPRHTPCLVARRKADRFRFRP